MENKKENNDHAQSKDTNKKLVLPAKDTSMSTLIIWNISKALEKSPTLKLKAALKAAQERLENKAADVTSIVDQEPGERHLSCALLAWQQLGHGNAESLYRFVETKLRQVEAEKTTRSTIPDTPEDHNNYQASSYLNDSIHYVPPPMGPVLKLPMEPKIVLRLDSTRPSCKPAQRIQKAGDDLKSKIAEACCLESGCVERLSQLDAHTKELRNRLARLARREAERVELLERAETAWRDLEVGYIRRHRTIVEKEEDMTRSNALLVKERTVNKEMCGRLVQQLKPRSDAAEALREKLKDVEAEVCVRACGRIKLSELSAREDAVLADAQCKLTQLDRDLQFKEEQARRQYQKLESDLESQRGLTFEAERAMRAELGGLKQQIKVVSDELLAEDETIAKLKAEIADHQQQKAEITEDLEGCLKKCDLGMKKKVDELKKKKDQLQELKDKVLDCKCKIPVDVGVMAKRTPSLAALCLCTPEDRYMDTCSCTSLRTRLLSDLLSHLFGGLQAELNSSGTKMPCQLLKCLEDRHNWDKASVVKTNLRNFFSKLLIGELDIAIATAIEKYHAQWVGNSCVDAARPIPRFDEHEGWEENVVEKRAQILASEMAEKMFNERADELVQRAKDVLKKGPPPCACEAPKSPDASKQVSNNTSTKNTAAFPVLVEQPRVLKSSAGALTKSSRHVTIPPTGNVQKQTGWQQAINDVNALREQIADLKKDTIKKEDLKLMEKKLTKMVQRVSSSENRESRDLTSKLPIVVPIEKKENMKQKNCNAEIIKNKKPVNAIKKKMDPDRLTGKIGRKQHIVNWCMCGIHKDMSKASKSQRSHYDPSEDQKPSKETNVSQMSSSIKQSKPIQELLYGDEGKLLDDDMKKQICGSECACFNKVPSCSSIDKLLDTLTKWRSDLNDDTPDVTSRFDLKNKVTIKSNDIISPPKHTETNSKNIETYRDSCTFRESKNDDQKIEGNIDEIGQKLPTTTVSEYMGAVNLEKSNEICCKCVTTHNSGEPNYLNETNGQVRCIASCECDSHCNKIKSRSNETAQIQNNDKKQSKENTVNKKNNDTSFDNFNNLYDVEPVRVHCEKVNRASDAHTFKQPVTNCDCGYEIKFLGVTLANPNSNKNAVNTLKNSSQLLNSYNTQLDSQYAYKIAHPITPISQATETIDVLKNKTPDQCRPTYPLQPCQCNVNIDELKDFFDTALKREMGDENDKKLPSSKYMIDTPPEKPDKCICCVNSFTEETNDLEVNAFILLEDHLRKRLKELKGSCKSSCIRPEEESKLFTTIFKKIKQTIKESTNNIVCKCSEEAKSEGSWQRAFILLQEYIKTKINRIQCDCASASQNKMILPDLTDKVCLLIENDFQRLKDICECKNSEKSMFRNKSFIDRIQTLKSERELIVCGTDDKTEIPNKAAIITQNTSAQIIPKNENKSCEAVVQNEHKTVDIQKSNIGDFRDFYMGDKGKNQEAISKKSVDVLTDHHSLLCEILGISPELIEPKETEIESDPVTSSPLIGYTIDCSCNSKLGSCICSKSTVRDNNDAIDKIWKTYTNVKRPLGNVDYIMKKINENKSNTDFVDFDPNTDQTAVLVESSAKLCDVDTSVHDDDDIVLKDSSQHFNMAPVNIQTNTVTNSIDGDDMSVDTGGDCVTDDPLEWFECASQTGHETPKAKSVHFHTDQGTILHSSVRRARSEVIGEDLSKLTEMLNQGCECSLVPICHVKMLMEDIEDKLVHFKCTCDSLNSKVCPVHAVKAT